RRTFFRFHRPKQLEVAWKYTLDFWYSQISIYLSSISQVSNTYLRAWRQLLLTSFTHKNRRHQYAEKRVLRFHIGGIYSSCRVCRGLSCAKVGQSIIL